MDNGERSETRSYPTGELVPFAPDAIVTPSDYQTNLQRIQQVKAALAFYEQQNIQGLQRFYEQTQVLEAAVEQGRIAAQRLAQLSGQPVTDILPTPLVPVPGPSNGPQPEVMPQYQAMAPSVEVPTSAHIVELPSPHMDRPAAGGSNQQNGFHNAHAQRSTPRQQGAYTQQHGGAMPTGPTNMANFQPTQTWRGFPGHASATRAGTYQQTYQSAGWTQNPQSNVHYQATAHAPQVFAAEAAQASFTAHAGRTAPLPHTAQSASTHFAGPSGLAQAMQASQAPQQPRYGASTASSLDGALGAGPSTAHGSVPHAKVTYSRQPQRANQAAAEPAQAAHAPTQVDPREEHHLFELFKGLSPGTVQKMMVQLLMVVERKQTGRSKTAAEVEASKLLNANLQVACEIVSERLKKYSIAEVKQVFIKLFNIMKIGREQAQAFSSDIMKVMPDRHPVPPQHPSGAPAQPGQQNMASTSATSHATATQTQTAPSTSSVAASSTSHTASAPNATVNGTAPVKASAGRAVNASQIPELQRFIPRDPTAPIAYRDASGQFRYVFPPTRTSASTPPTSATPAVPSFVSRSQATAQEPRAPPVTVTAVEPPGTPEQVEIRPASPWSPEKADRRRLAQDIMRSLGRPRGSFGEPLVATSGAPKSAEETEIDKTSKRKSPSSPGVSTPSKRQRTEEPERVVTSTPASIPTADVVDLTSSTPPISTETVVEPVPVSPDSAPEPATSVTELATDVSDGPGGTTVTIPFPEREGSTAPSDADKVQEMLPEPPESDASGPPSSMKSPSPSSPSREAPDVIDLPSVDERLFAVDVPDAPAEDSVPSHVPPETERTSSPASSTRDKIPLFLPSPSSSPGTSGSQGASAAAPDGDETESDDSIGPRPLYGHKGKGKARQLAMDIDLTAPPVSPRRRWRGRVYVEAPPLPEYARRLREASVASTSASASAAEESVDELAAWHDEEVQREHEEEARSVAELVCNTMRESPCQWQGCGAVLNSASTLQKHVVAHARDNEDWGTFSCRWQTCSYRFSDKTKLAKHLRKHATSPMYCAYEGCDKAFNTVEALLAHHKSSRHRSGSLRGTPAPHAPAENRRALSPLPDVLPAYMSIPRRVARHPISKERHQWLGPKVLENITAFKYTGGRSNAAEAPRGSRRLAEKVATTELAGVSPEVALEQIKRWTDDEYLAFADGYDAGRRPWLRCPDIPSQEATALIDRGLVFWPGVGAPEDEDADARNQNVGDAHAHVADRGSARPSVGPEAREDTNADGRSVGQPDNDARAEESVVGASDLANDAADGGGAAADAGDSEGPGADQLAGEGADGERAGSAPEVDKGQDAGGPGAREILDVDACGFDESPDRGGGVVQQQQQQLVASDSEVKMEDGHDIPWPVWPPLGRADSEAVESLI